MRSTRNSVTSTSSTSGALQEVDYKHAFELLNAAIFTCDMTGNIIHFNDAAVHLWGETPEAGNHRWRFGSDNIFDGLNQPIQPDRTPTALAIENNTRIVGKHIIIKRPNGDRVSAIIYVNPIIGDNKKPVGAVSLMFEASSLKELIARTEGLAAAAERDMLEREVAIRTAELIRKNDELRLSEERYHRMVAEVQDYAIILLDKDGFIQNWNRGAERIKGYEASEIIGKNFRIFYTPEDRANHVPDQLIEEARLHQRAQKEGWRVRKDGTKFWGSITMTSLHDQNNQVIGFTKVTRDLTERKRAEDALHENAAELERTNKQLAQMNQELASFAYVSSHDLQEPLRKIQTFATRILETEEAALSAKAKDYFGRMQNAAMRMQTLIEDLLSYSRTNTEEKVFENADLNSLLEDVKLELHETMEEKSATITSEPLPILPVIKFQFRQLLHNVIGNAMKFSHPDIAPIVQITTNTVEAKDIPIHDNGHNEVFTHIAITDNGIGFESEHRFKIFEVFQRLHGRSEYSGTGIGLAICKKIMDNHRGFITAESEPGKGSTFHLYFPRH